MRKFKGYRAGHHISAAQLSAGLADHIDDLLSYLGIRGELIGQNLVGRNPTRPDRHAGSFNVCVKGPAPFEGGRCGLWHDYATGDGGDALDLISYVANTDFRGACDIAKQILGWGDVDNLPDIPKVQVRPKEEHENIEPEENKVARAIFLSSVKDVLGTPVDMYLQGRGIDLRRFRLKDKPYLPGSIRFNPAVNCGDGRTCPAMVCPRITCSGVYTGLHITFLKQDGDKWRKNRDLYGGGKKMLGRAPGSVVGIWKGETGESLPNASGDILIAEGIETALSVAVENQDKRVIASTSVNNMININLPDAVKRVYLCIDYDGERAPSAVAYNKAAARFISQGREVLAVYPPKNDAGERYDDFNDALIAELSAAEGGEHAPF